MIARKHKGNDGYLTVQIVPPTRKESISTFISDWAQHILTKLRPFPSAAYGSSVFVLHSEDGSTPHIVKMSAQRRKCSIGRSRKCSMRINRLDKEHATLLFDPESDQVSVVVISERKHIYIDSTVEPCEDYSSRIEKKDGPKLLPRESALLLDRRSWVTVLPNIADALVLTSRQGHSAYCSDSQPQLVVGRAIREPNNTLSSGNDIELDVEAAERHHYSIRRVSSVFILKVMNYTKYRRCD